MLSVKLRFRRTRSNQVQLLHHLPLGLQLVGSLESHACAEGVSPQRIGPLGLQASDLRDICRRHLLNGLQWQLPFVNAQRLHAIKGTRLAQTLSQRFQT
ncbi:hypothetical protein D3C80_1833890 [compost metagenome]